MRADMLDLLVERRLGDLAFLDIHHQPAVGADEADVQALLELVPLAADHDAVAIAVGLRAGNDRRDEPGIKPANALEQIADLLVLEPELGRVGQVLVLAAAALAEVAAGRFDPLRGRADHAQQPGPGESLLHLRDLRFHDFARSDERDEDDKILDARDAFAPEGNVAQSSRSTCRPSQTHAEERSEFRSQA